MNHLLVALGNPGKEYVFSRHNAGWMLADFMASELDIAFKLEKKHQAEIATSADKKSVLMKPQTYMNNSGAAVASYRKYHPFEPSQVVVVFDDLDLPLGKYKISQKPPKVHNGVSSVISHLGQDAGLYVRLGIDARVPENRIAGSEYVLAPFTSAEKEIFGQMLTLCTADLLKQLSLHKGA
jgi:peptidyl-tRNA hydrolase, PTH1 family